MKTKTDQSPINFEYIGFQLTGQPVVRFGTASLLLDITYLIE